MEEDPSAWEVRPEWALGSEDLDMVTLIRFFTPAGAEVLRVEIEGSLWGPLGKGSRC